MLLWLIIKSIAITLHTCIVIIIVECFAVPARGGSYSGPADPLPHHTCQDKGEIREGERLKSKQISIFFWLPLAQCLCISRHLGQVRGHWSATTRLMRTSTCPGPMWKSKGWTQTSRGSRWWLQTRKSTEHFNFDFWLATFSWLAILVTSASSFNHVDINFLAVHFVVLIDSMKIVLIIDMHFAINE